MSNEEIRKEVQKLLMEEIDIFLRKHKPTLVKRALKKWKLRQQDAQQEMSSNGEQELQELD